MAATSTSSDPSAATATATASSDGPVLNVISKRLRALRKKHNRIIQMEESLSQGKTLNSEQQEVLRSKPAVIASIDELEKLRSPISSALEEEISLAISSSSSSSKLASSSEAENKTEEQQQQASSQEKEEKENDDHNHGNGYEVVKDLLNLMYFGSLFDVKPQSDFTSLMITRNHERSCCLTYDYVTDDATDLLAYGDLDLISALQGLMVSRPNAPVSHQNALEQCIQHAKLWLENSQQPIDPQANVTYAGLKEKLNKIMASDYFTATPQMKGPGEVAAAAVGNFGSFQVPMHENMVTVEVPVEGSVEHYPDTEDHEANYEEYETGEQQTGNADEFQKGDVEAENPAEMVSAHTEQEQAQAEEEHGFRNVDYKEQQYIPRRGQRGGRGGGGGRRGYSNGRGGRVNARGGGPYQNGRNQYHENYYPRNNYYNRRGGRGAGGPGNGRNPHYNQSSAGQGNHTQANMGVAS